jgi:TM2 domain-containing membrane protein YozV
LGLNKLPNYCPNCGADLKYPEAEICPTCGVRIKEPQSPKKEKNPVVAALLSLIITGSGQVYNGELLKGILIFIGAIIGSLFFLIPGIIVVIYGIYDAYTTAKKMNAGEIQYKESTTLEVVLFIIIWVIIFFIILALFAAFLFGMATSGYY